MEKFEIKREYEVSNISEISVDWNGFNYLIIYGHHINGWFIAIPNWNVCVEAAEPSNLSYNEEKLYDALRDVDASKAITETIKEHWEGRNA